MQKPPLSLIVGVMCIWTVAAQPSTGVSPESGTGHQEQAGNAERIPYVAVNKLEARGVTDDEAAILTDVLRTELFNTNKVRVMERGEMEQILKEQGFQQSGACNDEACIVEMGQLLGAEQLVAGTIGKVGKAYSINVRIISMQTSEIVRNVAHNYTGPIEDLLTDEMRKVAWRLLGIALKPEDLLPAAPPVAVAPSQPVAPVPVPSPPRRKRPVAVIAVSTAIVAAGGAAAYFLVGPGKKGDEPNDQPPAYTSIEVTW